MSAVATIREEIADLEGYIAGLPLALRDGPYGLVYSDRLESLRDELNEEDLRATAISNGAPAMDLRIWGETVAREHQVPAELLGELLQRWQGLFWALGQAATGKPTARGQIPDQVVRETRLAVSAFAPGSFVTRLLLNPDPQQQLGEVETLGVRAFSRFEKLWSAGNEHHQLSLVLHDLQGRVLSSYTKLLGLLDAWDASVDVTMAEPGKEVVRHVRVDLERVRGVLPKLGEVLPAEVAEQVSVGILNAANRRTGTFEIDLGEEGTVTGNVSPADLLEGKTIGEMYLFHLAQMVTTDPFTRRAEVSWVMLSAADPNGEKL